MIAPAHPDKLPSPAGVDVPFGDNFIDGVKQVEKIADLFDHTRAKALGTEESRERLTRIVKETRWP